VPIVTVVGDDAEIVGTIASNLAASAAYEARSTLLVDVDAARSVISSVLRVRPTPGFGEIVSGTADWADAIVSTTIGRDRPLDVVPSGSRQARAPSPEIAERIREDFARMERRYDLIVIAAPISYILEQSTAVIPSPDVVVCARIGYTRISSLRKSVERLRKLDLRVHGIVLWNDHPPQIDSRAQRVSVSADSKRDSAQLVGTY
jgi:Mrp family chromosome partitioning ATPase